MLPTLLLSASLALAAPTQFNRVLGNSTELNSTSIYNSTSPTEYAALVPAHASGTASGSGTANGTGTLDVGWKSSEGAGAFQDSFVRLYAGDGSSNATVLSENGVTYGLLLKFDPVAAAGQIGAQVPFFALISCDNATASGTTDNMTAAAVNSTSSLADAFQLAAARDASLAILYSETDETCTLDDDYLTGNATKPLPIWTSPSLETTTMLLDQFSHISSNLTTYNATILSLLSANLTSALTTGSTSAVELVGFLAASLTPVNTTSNTTSGSGSGSGPVVVSIAPAPSKTAAASAVATGAGSTSAAGSVGGTGGVVGVALAAVVGWAGWVLLM